MPWRPPVPPLLVRAAALSRPRVPAALCPPVLPPAMGSGPAAARLRRDMNGVGKMWGKGGKHKQANTAKKAARAGVDGLPGLDSPGALLEERQLPADSAPPEPSPAELDAADEAAAGQVDAPPGATPALEELFIALGREDSPPREEPPENVDRASRYFPAEATTHTRTPYASLFADLSDPFRPPVPGPPVNLQVDNRAPWLPPGLDLPADRASALDIELPHLAAFLLPDEREHGVRLDALERLEKAAGKAAAGYEFRAGGSFMAATGSWDADLDCVAVPRGHRAGSDGEEMPDKMLQSRALGKIMKRLRVAGWEAKLISRARVPVLKIVDPDTQLRIDLTALQPSLLRSLLATRRLLSAVPGAHPAAVFLKRFLRLRDLHEPFEGGLGGYASVLLACWAARRNPHLGPGGALISLLRLLAGQPDPDSGRPLYSSELSLSPHPPHRPLSRPSRGPPGLRISDPADPANDAARAFRQLAPLRQAAAQALSLIAGSEGSPAASVVPWSAGEHRRRAAMDLREARGGWDGDEVLVRPAKHRPNAKERRKAARALAREAAGRQGGKRGLREISRAFDELDEEEDVEGGGRRFKRTKRGKEAWDEIEAAVRELEEAKGAVALLPDEDGDSVPSSDDEARPSFSGIGAPRKQGKPPRPPRDSGSDSDSPRTRAKRPRAPPSSRQRFTFRADGFDTFLDDAGADVALRSPGYRGEAVRFELRGERLPSRETTGKGGMDRGGKKGKGGKRGRGSGGDGEGWEGREVPRGKAKAGKGKQGTKSGKGLAPPAWSTDRRSVGPRY
ncbi:hypothetical protein DFJ74DRAFT_290036 [Hyaloraphidium curvatum]|nr:hypothetical protein DFJ74DRAFT_290036 [Hyaloraphidium curvatum]